MYCAHCGHENPAGANFCANWGRPRTMRDDDTTGVMRSEIEVDVAERETGAEAGVATSELEPGTALLVATRGPNRGVRFLLDRGLTTVGRHSE